MKCIKTTSIIMILPNRNTHMQLYNKKDGYRQWNMRQFLHILASPGYAPKTIMVNVTWMERELNAGQMHCSMYLSIFNCFPVIKAVKIQRSPF